MKKVKPHEIRENDCVLFYRAGTSAILRVAKVERDEQFADPSGDGTMWVMHFDTREAYPSRAEVPPTTDLIVLEADDLAAAFSSGCHAVQAFADAAVPAIKSTLEELASLEPDQLRELVEVAKRRADDA